MLKGTSPGLAGSVDWRMSEVAMTKLGGDQQIFHNVGKEKGEGLCSRITRGDVNLRGGGIEGSERERCLMTPDTQSRKL